MSMQRKGVLKLCMFFVLAATAAFMFGGCSDGKNGFNGLNGTSASSGPVDAAALPAEDLAKLTLKGEVTSVTINSPPVVKFKVTDVNNNPVIGLGIRKADNSGYNNLGFSIAKLVPAPVNTHAPSKWVSYIVTTTATPALGSKPTTDTEGTLVDNGDGSYQYTFKRDIKLAAAAAAALVDAGDKRKADLGDLSYAPTLTHRVVVQIGGNILNTSPSIPFKNPANLIYDFIPATGKVVTATDSQREVVTIAACNECHGKLAFHSGGVRVDTRFCVVCHTSQRAYGNPLVVSIAGAFPAVVKDATGKITSANTYIADGEVAGEFVTMIHKIHQGNKLNKINYNYAGVLFDKLGYPQDQGLCRKCHKAEASLQGDNWNLKPSRLACGSCHDNINFATGANSKPASGAYLGLAHVVESTDENCTTCHTAAAIKTFHIQLNKTTYNPETAAGLVNFTYEIQSITAVAATSVAVKFKISDADTGTPVTLLAPTAGMVNPLTGFTSGPSFLIAYTKTQDGITTPADYNNLGNGVASAQPVSVKLSDLLDSNKSLTVGTIAGPDGSGYYTANIVGAANVFPASASMRTVALQGYFTQVAPAAARHTKSVVKTVTGDTARRVVVDPAKCGKCHEWFEGHGGNRVYETQVCVVCHNPNLSTSGRTITDAKLSGYTFTAIQQAILLAWDPAFDKTTVGYSLTFPEFTNNFKELIHGIHAGKDRTKPLRDVRNGSSSSITLVNAGDFGFPNILSNCDVCHVTPPTGTNKQTWKADLPAGVLASTNVSLDVNNVNPTIAQKLAARSTVPNVQDIVNSPILGACVSCHDDPVAKAHMNANGGQLGAAQAGPSYTDLGIARAVNNLAAEQCALCHGEGKIADVVTMHAK